jgi:NAD(P)-dependent dehydrogenase (short-subunit alcohol dehydrogenase family)
LYVEARKLKKLANKAAVITGAAHGLGRAMAELFAGEGAFVFIADMDGKGAEAVASAICHAGGDAQAVAMDVRKESDVQNLAKIAGSRFSALDVLVNNAGNLIRKDFRHLEDNDWASIVETHLWGTVRVTRALLPALQRAGESGGAAIVNLASIMAGKHARQVSSYSASKAAIEGLSRSLAIEFAPYGIRVNYVCPGFVPTAMTRQYTRPGFSEGLLRQIPMRRFGTPLEIAKAVLFLSCEDSSYITGQGITADGGMTVNLV